MLLSKVLTFKTIEKLMISCYTLEMCKVIWMKNKLVYENMRTQAKKLFYNYFQ
jgi:hypothetical protein